MKALVVDVKKNFLLTLASIVSMVLVVTFLVGLPRASAQDTPVIVPSSESVDFQAEYRVPVVDTQAGVGSSLGVVPGSSLDVGAQVPAEHASALVRLSLFEVQSDTTVFVDGFPALFVPAGESGSAVTFAAVREGKVAVYADRVEDARVEVLASFAADDLAPGAWQVLGSPEVRANTVEGLGADAVSAEPTDIGVLGLGGVPLEGVRAVAVTADVQVGEATTLYLGNQEFPLVAGRNIVTALVVPDEQGLVQARLGSGSGSLVLVVRGYASSLQQNHTLMNVPGSFVPLGGSAQQMQVQAGVADYLEGNFEDYDYVLAQVSASAGGLTLVDAADYPGRARGVVARGGAGELVLLPVGADGRVGLTSSHMQADARVTPVGGLLSADAAAAADVAVEVTSHQSGARIDLTETGTFELAGTVKNAEAVARVEVVHAGEVVGLARLTYLPDGTVRWSYQTSTPGAGEFDIAFRAYDVSGRRVATDSVKVSTVVPASDEVVVSEKAVVVEPVTASGDPVVAGVTAETVTLVELPEGLQPGDVLVSDVAQNAPEGFLRRVVAFDFVEGEGWVVQTEQAQIQDVILQADIDEVRDVTDLIDPSAAVENIEVQASDWEYVVEGDELVETSIVSEEELAALSPLDFASSSLSLSEEEAQAEVVDPGISTGEAVENTARVSDVVFGGLASGAWGRPQASLASNETVAIHEAAKLEATHNLVYRKFSFNFGFDVSGKRVTDYRLPKGTGLGKRGEFRAGGGVHSSVDVLVNLAVSLRIDIDADFSWGIPKVKLNSLSATIDPTIRLDASTLARLEIKREISWNALRIPVFDAPISFLIGPVPVVINNEVTVGIKYEAEAEIDIEFNNSAKMSGRFGLEVRDRSGVLSPRRVIEPEWGFAKPKGYSTRAGGSGEFGVGPEFSFSTTLYDTAGPEIDVYSLHGIGAEVRADDAGKLSISGDVFYKLGLEGSIDFSIPIIDKNIATFRFGKIEKRASIAEFEIASEPLDSPVNPDAPSEPVERETVPVLEGIYDPNGGEYLPVGQATGFVNSWGSEGIGNHHDRSSQSVYPEGFDVLIGNDGWVYARGHDFQGSLGVGPVRRNENSDYGYVDVYTPVLRGEISDNERIVQVSQGSWGLSGGVIALSTQGNLYIWGNWGTWEGDIFSDVVVGRFPDGLVTHPIKVDLGANLEKVKVKKIASHPNGSTSHYYGLYVIGTDGEIYFSGNSYHFDVEIEYDEYTGYPNPVGESVKFQNSFIKLSRGEIPEGETIVNIALDFSREYNWISGGYYVVLTDVGKVYVGGRYDDSWIQGLKNPPVWSGNPDHEWLMHYRYYAPRELDSGEIPDGRTIKQVSPINRYDWGYRSMGLLLLDSAGEVYVWAPYNSLRYLTDDSSAADFMGVPLESNQEDGSFETRILKPRKASLLDFGDRPVISIGSPLTWAGYYGSALFKISDGEYLEYSPAGDRYPARLRKAEFLNGFGLIRCLYGESGDHYDNEFIHMDLSQISIMAPTYTMVLDRQGRVWNYGVGYSLPGKNVDNIDCRS